MTTSYPALATSNRWWQLVLGMIAMMAISSPQYVWTLFVKPIQATFGVPLSALQVTFSLLIVLQCGFGPMHGYLVERFSPRRLLSIGGLLTGGSWVASAYATHLSTLYLTYGIIGGIGIGIVYVGVVGQMVRWFPDRRGFATGMAAGSYGFGAIVTTFPIDSAIKASGYQHTLLVFGIIIGVVCILASLGMRNAPEDWMAESMAKKGETGNQRSYRPGEMLKTPIFWLLFVMMTMMATSGLMVISQMGAFAKDFGVAKATVFGMAALPLALSVDRVTNGLTRPLFGWISDHLGRENTMTFAFTLEALSILVLLACKDNAVAFVLLSGIVFLGWGEIFSLFPSIQCDIFGPKYAGNNYGFLLMAQGAGSILGGPLAALVHEQTHSWMPVFYTIIGMDLLTAMLAYFVLKPMRKRWSASEQQESVVPAYAE